MNAILEPIRWETHAISGKSTRSQEVITNSIGEYDIYIGLMGFYFGSSTGEFSSGTEEEFNDALELNAKHDIPIIQFYFSSAKIDPRKIDIDQFNRVEQFRKKIGSEHGVFYKNFEDLNELSTHVRRGLTDAFFSLIKKIDASEKSGAPFPRAGHTPSYGSLGPYETLKTLNAEFSKNSNAYTHYLLHQSTTHFKSMTDRFGKVSEKILKTTKTIQRATHEMSKFTSGKTSSGARAQKSTIEMIEGVEALNYWLIDEITKFRDDFSRGLENFQRAAIIMKTSSEFSDEELNELDVAKETAADHIEIFCKRLEITSESFPEIDTLGPRWAASRIIFRAVMLDFSDLLSASNKILRQSSTLYRRTHP